MSTALQNRLVGTIIIVALAVIFLPDILDGKKETTQAVFVDLPPQPEMSSVSEPPAFPLEEVKQKATIKTELVADVATDDFEIQESELASDSSEAQDQADQVNELEEQKSASAAVILSSATSPQVEAPVSAGFVVQLGVFRHQKNVQELLGRLRQNGYKAFSRPVKTSSGELTKVFVGPELDKQSLQESLPALEKLTKLKGRISPFSIK